MLKWFVAGNMQIWSSRKVYHHYRQCQHAELILYYRIRWISAAPSWLYTGWQIHRQLDFRKKMWHHVEAVESQQSVVAYCLIRYLFCCRNLLKFITVMHIVIWYAVRSLLCITVSNYTV